MTTSAIDSTSQTGVPAGGHYVHRLVREFLDARCMDCMELMAEYPDKHFDLAIVDPPYGAGDTIFDTSKVVANKTTKHAPKKWNNAVPDAAYWSELFRVAKHVIAWGGNYFSPHLPPSRGWIVWDKKYQGMHSFASAELAFSTFDRNAEMFSWRKPEAKEHPCQKPVALYRWLLDTYAKPGQRILDTHLGSGSIAIACHYARLHLTACEIDEDYFKAACARIERETAQESFCFPNVPSDLSLLAFGIPPAREAESAGGMPKVPKGQGLGRLDR